MHQFPQLPEPEPYGVKERLEELFAPLDRFPSWLVAAGSLLAAAAVVAALAFVAWPEPDVPKVEDAIPLATKGLSSATVHVHVSGAVVAPGLYRLPARSRVADAIDAARGIAPSADPADLNLAALVRDGDRIHIRAAGEVERIPSAGSAPSQLVDVNTADRSTLEDLPGIGPALASAIVEHRDRNGPFASLDDLLNVAGIGPSKLAALRDGAQAS